MDTSLRELFLLDPTVTFLNHGSFGACPRPVFERYQRWQRELEAQPVEFLGRRIDGLLAEARAALADYLGTQAGNIVFVPNATYGVNIVAHSLARQLRPGDEVLTSDHEYGASDRAWRFLANHSGFRYVSQHIALPLHSHEEFIEQLWAGVTERTKVIFLSHITSPTALTFPVAEVCRRAREAGIITVIDGAHAPGQIDLNLDMVGADFYTGNCHKWLLAPKGSAFLYARPERQSQLEPLVVSWGWESLNPSESLFHDHFSWTGTKDPAAYLTVPAAIAFQREHNWPEVRAESHAMLVEFSRQLQEITDLAPISPDGADWWGQMRALPLPHFDLTEAKNRLYDELRVEVPLLTWNNMPLVRVSVQAYNTEDHLERLLEGLQRMF